MRSSRQNQTPLHWILGSKFGSKELYLCLFGHVQLCFEMALTFDTWAYLRLRIEERPHTWISSISTSGVQTIILYDFINIIFLLNVDCRIPLHHSLQPPSHRTLGLEILTFVLVPMASSVYSCFPFEFEGKKHFSRFCF